MGTYKLIHLSNVVYSRAQEPQPRRFSIQKLFAQDLVQTCSIYCPAGPGVGRLASLVAQGANAKLCLAIQWLILGYWKMKWKLLQYIGVLYWGYMRYWKNKWKQL